MSEVVNAAELIKFHKDRIALYSPVLENLKTDAKKYRDIAEKLPHSLVDDGFPGGGVNRHRMYYFFLDLLNMEGDVTALIKSSQEHISRLEKESMGR